MECNEEMVHPNDDIQSSMLHGNEIQSSGWSTVTKHSTIPAEIHKFLGAVALNPDQGGEIAVASSNLTGRYWDGGVFTWPSPNLALDIEKCCGGTQTETGIGDMKYINAHLLFVGEDSGTVDVYKINRSDGKNENDLMCLQTTQDHDGAVLCLGVDADGKTGVTGSDDGSIYIWEMEEFSKVLTYRPAHTEGVSSVSIHPTNSGLLLSSSCDGSTALWDTRTSKKALSVSKLGSGATSSCWVPITSNTIVEGCDDGSLRVRDTRRLVGSIHRTVPHNRPVYRLEPHQHGGSFLVASCADDVEVVVVSVTSTSSSVLYKNDHHNDFVRGLTWQKESQILYSCGWDKRLIKHSIPL